MQGGMGGGAGYRPAGEDARCVVCDAPLTVHERATGTSCRKLACLTAVGAAAQRKAERERRADLDAALAWFEANEGELGAQAGQVAAVPYSGRVVSDADPERVAQFRDLLTTAMAEAVAGKPPPAVEPSPPLDPELERTLGWGCALCTGRCCARGGVHAFLSAEELALKLAAEPALTPDDLLAVYVDALPERSIEGSCVFHTETGCALPRQARARICNEWLCKGLWEWAGALEGGEPVRLRVASVDQGVVRRAAAIEAGEVVLRLP